MVRVKNLLNYPHCPLASSTVNLEQAQESGIFGRIKMSLLLLLPSNLSRSTIMLQSRALAFVYRRAENEPTLLIDLTRRF